MRPSRSVRYAGRMGAARCFSARLAGLSLEAIEVETDISNGLNAVSIVGLGDRAIEEAKDRVSAAIKNAGFVSPKQKNQKVVISLAPADVRKEGPAFDLAIAVSYLSASGDIAEPPDEGSLFLGELSLHGEVRRISGLLPVLCQARARGFDRAYIPSENADEASLVSGEVAVFPVRTLAELVSSLRGETEIRPLAPGPYRAQGSSSPIDDAPDMSVIRGNSSAKRALEIAAAGAHNIILFGPPGTGKTLLARSFQTILPPLSREETIEVTGIHSVARALGAGLVTRPPFRAPHHTASYPAIVGGGASPRPGEISLAHRGVLFMDEFPEFDRAVIESLRQPLEERRIVIARAKGSVSLPANCILIASMNPCPCGKPRGNGCVCRDRDIELYRRRISAPILDRIDLWVNVDRVDYIGLAAQSSAEESSAAIRARVERAREAQRERFARAGSPKRFNSEMDAAEVQSIARMRDDARFALARAAEEMGLSGRAFHRMMKVAQTIADLRGNGEAGALHMREALRYRQRIDGSIERAD